MAKRGAKGAAREAAVVGAAAEAIAEHGLANVRVSDIAERAGISPGHVTYYFPSKTELLMQAIRRSERSLADDVAHEIAGVDDAWERLDLLIELSASQGVGDPGWQLWFEVWSQAALDPMIAQVHDELDGQWRAILADAVRYGCERGAFETDDPDEAALMLSAVIDGLSIQLSLGSADLDHAGLLRRCRAAARLYLTPSPPRSHSTRR
jgi:AcrR family transcriptional regulator